MSSSVLVTGGDGLVGAWLVKVLLERGGRVVVIRRDTLAVSALAQLGLEGSVDIVHGDICADGLVGRVLNEYEVQGVFHLAAQTQVGPANRSPVPTFETNIRGSWLVLEACRLHEVDRVVVASSDKAYGRQADLPYRETHPLRPQFPYDVSKAACDLLARSYWHTFGLPVAVTRLANVYGGADLNRARLIPEAVCAALAGEPPVVRSDGSPERDFLYVEDAVGAYLAVWDALGRGAGRGEAFNAGGGRAPPRARRGRADLPPGRRVGRPGDPRRGRAAWRDRPAVARLAQATRADGLAPGGGARGGPAADDRVVPRAPGGADSLDLAAGARRGPWASENHCITCQFSPEPGTVAEYACGTCA